MTDGVHVQRTDAGVYTLEFDAPPDNHLSVPLLGAIADALENLDAVDTCRAVILCSAGRHFCAGVAIETDPAAGVTAADRHLYDEALRVFATKKPIVAAVQGAAVGAGLGLALAADFRIAASSSRFVANFARLGLHPGFGLSVTLPALVGTQVAKDMFFTGRRVRGEQAHCLGLCDHLVAEDLLRAKAAELATTIAESAPGAVRSIRATMRGALTDQVAHAMTNERAWQDTQKRSFNFREGVAAYRERRPPRFEDD
jgi:2-(1,2-epoxy-1,2-dihydrophenyl)acetyl-CoA isomerase